MLLDNDLFISKLNSFLNFNWKRKGDDITEIQIRKKQYLKLLFFVIAFYIAQFTHLNQPIHRFATNRILSLPITFKDKHKKKENTFLMFNIFIRLSNPQEKSIFHSLLRSISHDQLHECTTNYHCITSIDKYSSDNIHLRKEKCDHHCMIKFVLRLSSFAYQLFKYNIQQDAPFILQRKLFK